MAEQNVLQQILDEVGLRYLWSRLKEKLNGKAPTQFVMTLTYDTSGSNNHSLDKTFAELEAAYQAGSQIRLVDTSGMEYELLAFAAGYMAYFAHQLNADRYLIGIRANNTITYSSEKPFTSNNPPNAAQVGAKGSDRVSRTSGSIKDWALAQTTSTSVGAHTNVTDLPETGAYWFVDLIVANSGLWRKLTATKATNDGTATTYECICMSGTWSAWKAVEPKVMNITLPASAWTGDGPYTQVITIAGATVNSQVDMEADDAVFDAMEADGVTTLYIKNDNGTITAVARGAAPTVNLTVQVTVTEVRV